MRLACYLKFSIHLILILLIITLNGENLVKSSEHSLTHNLKEKDKGSNMVEFEAMQHSIRNQYKLVIPNTRLFKSID